MNKKQYFSVFCLFVLCATTIGIATAQHSQSSIATSQVNSNRAERAINSRKKHRERSNRDRIVRSQSHLSQSYQTQQTTVVLNSSELNRTNLLSISTSAPEVRLTGKIFIGDRLIKSFMGNDVLDLSPYLTLGKQIVTISGDYTPSNTSVKIEFEGESTRISQETQGSGKLQQQLIFHVR